jgi:hypothetical protein
MRGLGSEVKADACRCAWSIGLRLPHIRPACAAAKTRADWVFVSGVSPVSLSLKLINEYRMENQERQGEGINWCSASRAGTGGTGATVAAI